MIIELVCPLLPIGSSQYMVVGATYVFLVEHTWLAWLVFGMLIGASILFRQIRSVTVFFCSVFVSVAVGVVMTAELIGACYDHITLPQSLAPLFSSEWAALIGIAVVATLHWLFGPKVERLLDRLTGRSHVRKDHLSDIRTVDSEIPRRPADFDPRKYFIRRQS